MWSWNVNGCRKLLHWLVLYHLSRQVRIRQKETKRHREKKWNILAFDWTGCHSLFMVSVFYKCVCVRVWGGVLEHGRMIPSWGLCSESKVCLRDRDLATLPHTLTYGLIHPADVILLLSSLILTYSRRKEHTLLVRLILQIFRIRLTTKIWNQNKIVEPIKNNCTK